MRQRNFCIPIFLVIFLASLLTSSPCAGAETNGQDEKLLSAIRDADLRSAGKLLSGGADVNARDEDGLTTLMYAAMYAGADCLELLLAKGADTNAKSNGDVTALMLAVGNVGKVRLLLAKGAEVNAKSKQGHTALSLAAGREGSAEVVKALLDQGAEFPAINLLGVAARSGDLRVVRLLLEKGADPNDRNNLGGAPPISPKRAAERSKSVRTNVSPLLGVAGNTAGTPLMFAAIERNSEVIGLLLEKGADINARHKGGGTALMMAAQMGHLKTVELLLARGAEVNVINEYGYTALMYAAAAESNDPEVIKALLARGSEINIKAKDEETALTLAGRKGRTEIVRLLEKAGAK